MAIPLSPQAKKKIAAAYKRFHAQIKKIAQTHRQKVTTLSGQIDQKHVADIKKRMGV